MTGSTGTGAVFAARTRACSEAWERHDWHAVEEHSRGALLAAGVQTPMGSLEDVARRYLASILGGGQFVTDQQSRAVARAKLVEFVSWAQAQRRLSTTLTQHLHATHKVLLLSLDDTDQARNKMAASLREIARPDLAIDVTGRVLQDSRLNYYARTIRAGAFADLGNYDDAIEELDEALRVAPEDVRPHAWVAMSRCLRKRFEVDGTLEDAEAALKYAKRAWEVRPDHYSANVYFAAAAAVGDEDELEAAEDALARSQSVEVEADRLAVANAVEVLQRAMDEPGPLKANEAEFRGGSQDV